MPGKFGRELNGLAVYLCTTKLNQLIFLACTYAYGDPLPNHQVKIVQYSYSGDFDPNGQITCQYFWLYSKCECFVRQTTV